MQAYNEAVQRWLKARTAAAQREQAAAALAARTVQQQAAAARQQGGDAAAGQIPWRTPPMAPVDPLTANWVPQWCAGQDSQVGLRQ